jgi:xanthine/uracil/vitamin C permease (AzgA family)
MTKNTKFGGEGKMEKFFKLTENGTTVKTEVIAGITTFATMAYILAVNANILGAGGLDQGAVFVATAIASVIGTMAMALLANLPWLRAWDSMLSLPMSLFHSSAGIPVCSCL